MEEQKNEEQTTEQTYEEEQTAQPEEHQLDQQQIQSANKLMDEYNPFETREDGSEIEINVGDPVQKEETFSNYTVYNVKGSDEHGAFDVYRRYNDFYELRRVLVQRWPGCFIPPIPPKKAVGATDSQVVDDRKRHLNNFCLKVSLRRHLYYSEEFQQFLRSNDTDIGKSYEKMPKLKAKDIIERYKDQFSQLNGKEITQSLMLEITNFLGYLKKAKAQLSKYKDISKQVAHLKKQYTSSVTLLVDMLMPEYEKHCLSQYTQGDENPYIFNNDSNQTSLGQLRSEVREQCGVNPFEFIHDMISFEYRDCEGFIEAIEQKNVYEKLKAKLQSKIRDQNEELLSLQQGKKTFKSFFKSGDNDQQKQKLEFDINNNTAECENISTLIDLITGILGFIEVEQFKHGKTKTYYKVMKSSAQLEVLTSAKMQNLWQDLAELSQQQLDNTKEQE